MITISEFRDNLRAIARPNRFMVHISSPFVNYPEKVRYLVQGTQIPARIIGDVNMKFHGMDLNLMGDPNHDDLTIDFINDYLWTSRDAFEQWMELNQEISKRNVRIPSNVSTGSSYIIVYQIGNSENEILASYKYFDVYPKKVGQIQLSMDLENTIEVFTVDFAYSYWERL